jgi:hypothetical protein
MQSLRRRHAGGLPVRNPSPSGSGSIVFLIRTLILSWFDFEKKMAKGPGICQNQKAKVLDLL